MSRIAHAARALLGDDAARERDRTGDEIALDDLVDQPDCERVFRRDGLAREDHAERLVDADEARQSLGAAGAGESIQA